MRLLDMVQKDLLQAFLDGEAPGQFHVSRLRDANNDQSIIITSRSSSRMITVSAEDDALESGPAVSAIPVLRIRSV